MASAVNSFAPNGKVDTTPRRYHGYAVLLFIMGTLFPPLAVAARFGMGKDFWLNLLLTIAGYIPGHVHNFYIQNIRNNKNHTRTPKWVQKYGLVDTSEIRRKARKSQWANRYNDRLPQSALEGQAYEEGQEGGSSVDLSVEGGSGGKNRRQNGGDLWRPEDENYYNAERASQNTSSGRWRYPANFNDAEPVPSPPKKSKKKKKDRWERTQDAYSMSAEGDSRKKKKKKRRSVDAESSIATNESGEFPEDPEGGLYGDAPVRASKSQPPQADRRDETVFNHEF